MQKVDEKEIKIERWEEERGMAEFCFPRKGSGGYFKHHRGRQTASSWRPQYDGDVTHGGQVTDLPSTGS